MPNLVDMISQLQPAADELRLLDDEVTASIKIVEEALRSLRVGIPFSCTVVGLGELSFRKLGRLWQLLWRSDVDDEWHQLVQAPRATRAAALTCVPHLIENAKTVLCEALVSRREIIANAKIVIDAMHHQLNSGKGSRE